MPLIAFLLFIALFILMEWLNRREEKKHTKAESPILTGTEIDYNYDGHPS